MIYILPTRPFLIRLAHKSSFWARSATVSAKRERASERKLRVLPHQTRKPCERLWESLISNTLKYQDLNFITSADQIPVIKKIWTVDITKTFARCLTCFGSGVLSLQGRVNQTSFSRASNYLSASYIFLLGCRSPTLPSKRSTRTKKTSG